jgi:hypothetical protein
VWGRLPASRAQAATLAQVQQLSLRVQQML